MKEFYLSHQFEVTKIPSDSVVFALGFFDGLHLGHQKVIKTAYELAKKNKLKLAVLTFDKQPAVVFKKFNPEFKKVLTPKARKRELLAKLGVDYCYIVDFNANFANLAPKDFVEEYLIKLKAQIVVAGFDYTFGKGGQKSLDDLLNYTQNRFTVVKIPPFLAKQNKVSSTWIRNLINDGSISKANLLLGTSYETRGIVVLGDARGRKLGFPTANIEVDEATLLPAEGVYITTILVAGKKYQSMGSIGTNETFGSKRRMSVEINIFDFSDNIYGEHVRVFWHKKIRSQKKFGNVQELIAQLNLDKKSAEEYFRKTVTD